MNPWIQTHKRDLLIAAISIAATLAIALIVFAVTNSSRKTTSVSVAPAINAVVTDRASTTPSAPVVAPVTPTTTVPTPAAAKPAPVVKPTTTAPTAVKPVAPVTTTSSGTIKSMTMKASVSDYAPNDRETVTITATVKDNYGRAVTRASVLAMVGFRAGTQAYKLTHRGNGVYTVSFVLGTRFYPGYRVTTNITATYLGKTVTASTNFIPAHD